MVSKTTAFLERSTADLVLGQEVIVAARWVLVAAAMVFALWLPAEVLQLRIQAFLILLLAVGNFFLHAQVLRRKPAADWLVYAASAADLFAITALLTVQGGFKSDLYIFYFPAVLAYSVAFASEYTLVYTLVALAAYAVIGTLTAPNDGAVLTIALRCLMIVAVAVCGHEYRRMEHRRTLRSLPSPSTNLRAEA